MNYFQLRNILSGANSILPNESVSITLLIADGNTLFILIITIQFHIQSHEFIFAYMTYIISSHRVLSPPDDRDLQAFVEHYSICPYIHEIRVSWTKSKERIPKNSIFSFTKNHAKVTFEKINGTFECTKNKFETPGGYLLNCITLLKIIV